MDLKNRLALVFGCCLFTSANGQSEEFHFFESKVRPLFVARCYKCHSEESGRKEAGLSLDSRESVLVGGDRGPALVVGKPEESLIAIAVSYRNAELQMPPENPITDQEMAILVQWIKQGAKMPAGATIPRKEVVIDFAEGRKHWTFQSLPNYDWGDKTVNPIDHWIEKRRKAKQLMPVARASSNQLVRRLSFDLTGLPPDWGVVNRFVDNPSIEQYELLVNQYLSSPQYGERWARFWLDLVRYTDTTSSWLKSTAGSHYYRDWVVRAFNEDMPYDQFAKLQLAADHIPESRSEDIAALGLLGLSPTYWKEPKLSPEVIKVVVAEEWEERVDMLGRTFLGLSLACARCHDHKFDPISQKDYYALAGVFASSRIFDIPLIQRNHREAIIETDERITQIELEIEHQTQLLKEEKGEKDTVQNAIDRAKQRISDLKASTPFYEVPRIPGVIDASIMVLPEPTGVWGTKLVYSKGQARNLHVQLRGNPSYVGEQVSRRYLEVFDNEKTPFGKGSGRLELAESLFRYSQGLVARVIVNRVWMHHFGKGLVATPSNFGFQGEKSTHPELLNDLAAGLVANGWSLKWLHRTIVTSDTYQLSSEIHLDSFEKDPENTSYWRANRRSLDFESWRDSVLKVTGSLDLTMGGPSLDLSVQENNRRTLYATIKRRELDTVLKMHGFPDPTGHSPKRDQVLTPLQQLYSLNSSFIWSRSGQYVESWKESLPVEERLAQLFRRFFSREAVPSELKMGTSYVALSGKESWIRYVHALLIANEFGFVD